MQIKFKYILLFSFYLFVVHAQSKNSDPHYSKAFASINLMLEQNSFDFKKAVFLTENAYYEKYLDENLFDDIITSYAAICKGIMASSGSIEYTERNKDVASSQCAAFHEQRRFFAKSDSKINK